MYISQILNDYLNKHKVYNLIHYSFDDTSDGEVMHPLFIVTQHIIDSLIVQGYKRIGIVLPDNECGVMPMIVGKYFSNLLDETDYARCVLDSIEVGQHVRLGKAVVEFLGIDKINNKIRFRTDRNNPIEIECPINGLHHMFEKTEGAISSYKIWYAAQAEARNKIANSDGLIYELKAKRTSLQKTLMVLAAKNAFKEYVEQLYINKQSFDDVVSYGELNLNNDSKYELYNKGRLDCLPAISVSSKMEEIYYLLKDSEHRNEVFAVFSMVEKFDEVISNLDTLKKVLKFNLPFVAFVPESEFENCPMLLDMGFEMWHWKPSTMKSESLLVDLNLGTARSKKDIFGGLSERVNRAALSEFKLETVTNRMLRDLVYSIKELSQLASDGDSCLRHFVRRVWNFHNKLTYAICPIKEVVKSSFENELLEIVFLWEEQKRFYVKQQIETVADSILNRFDLLVSIEKSLKMKKIEDFIVQHKNADKSMLLLLPDKYEFIDETTEYFKSIQGGIDLRVSTLSNFYKQQDKEFASVDYLIVPWFDKREYLRIKQTYCYEYLTYVLYDFENKWREHYVKKFDECIPHETVKSVANEVRFNSEEILEKPIDDVFITETDSCDDISDYNTPSAIIRSTFVGTGVSQSSTNAVECIPVLLTKDKIAYFYPSHDVIDVTLLVDGESDRPIKKEATKLKKGDKILIRQSDKDIVKEKADELMAIHKEQNLRSKAEIWSVLLNAYAKNKTVSEVCTGLNAEGGECTLQQVRYWLSGEVIMPRDKDVLIAIGIAASNDLEIKALCDEYLNSIEQICAAGQKIQSYHQQAGKWLTNELKNKANEIKLINMSDDPSGEILGIGDIYIYTVEDVLEKELIERGKINKIEDMY